MEGGAAFIMSQSLGQSELKGAGGGGPKLSKANTQSSAGIPTTAHLLIYYCFPQVQTWGLGGLKFEGKEE